MGEETESHTPDQPVRLRALAYRALKDLGSAVRGIPRAIKERLDRIDWTAPWTEPGWFGRNYLRVLGWLAIPIGAVLLAIAYLILGNLALLLSGGIGADARGHAYAIGVLFTALAVIAAAPFFLIKAWVNERNTTTAEQGHITDRLTKAIEQLGAEKSVKRRGREVTWHAPPQGEEWESPELIERFHAVEYADGPRLLLSADPATVGQGEWKTLEQTVANIEVRLGAIYAMERIAQDSLRDHIPVMETLCAYIRENAPARGLEDHGLGPYPEFPDPPDAEAVKAWEEATDERAKKLEEWAERLPPPRADIQAALDVIGRRSDHQCVQEADRGYRLDLRETNLRRTDLKFANLKRARLDGARLESASLFKAKMDEASLGRAHLEWATLGGVYLAEAWLGAAFFEGAKLIEASLRRSLLDKANLNGASLFGADMKGASLEEAHLEGAWLAGARLEGARLIKANLKGAKLLDAHLKGTSLIDARFDGAWLIATDLVDARVERASLQFSDLRDSQFARASLRSADFSRAQRMTSEQVKSAFGVREGFGLTRLPDGLDPPAHWHAAEAAAEDSGEARNAYREAYEAWLATLDGDPEPGG